MRPTGRFASVCERFIGLAAAFMASSILSGANFDVRPAEMEKEAAIVRLNRLFS